MPGRLDRIEAMLRAAVGDVLFERVPGIALDINAVLVRFGRTQDTLPDLFARVDSLLFNAVYVATDRSMAVRRAGGERMRLSTDDIRELADRLLALVYIDAPATPQLQETLFDFSRRGSFAAMRALAARYPLDEFERAYLMRVLEENGQTE